MSLTEEVTKCKMEDGKRQRERELPDYQGSRRGKRRGKRRFTGRDCGDKHPEAESVLLVNSGTILCKSCSTVEQLFIDCYIVGFVLHVCFDNCIIVPN